MRKFFLAVLGGALALTVPAYAETPFKPMDQTLPELLADGWEVTSQISPGGVLLVKGDQLSLCLVNLTGGHLQYLDGETDRAERFSTIQANCASLIE